jgi:putative endonuclease
MSFPNRTKFAIGKPSYRFPISKRCTFDSRMTSSMKKYYIYILASGKNGTLYIGMTNDLIKRIYQHKDKSILGFTKKYNVDKLVYFEEYNDINQTITREKQLKKWNRSWKIKLIEVKNKNWNDLYKDIL